VSLGIAVTQDVHLRATSAAYRDWFAANADAFGTVTVYIEPMDESLTTWKAQYIVEPRRPARDGFPETAFRTITTTPADPRWLEARP